MKTTTLTLILFLTGLDLWAQNMPLIRQTTNRIHTVTTNIGSAAGPATPAAPAPAAMPVAPAVPAAATAPTTVPGAASPADASSGASPQEEMIPAGNINFQGVDLSQVLEVYSKLVGRTLLRAGLPQASIILKTETPLTKTEAIEALQAVLALNGISVVNVGDKFVKVLTSDQAGTAGAAFSDDSASQVDGPGAYVTGIVQLT